MGFIRRAIERKVSDSIRQDPAARAAISAIENWDIYDYSEAARSKADRAYDILSSRLGDYGSTKMLYEEVLKTSGLPIPLCAIYAFVNELYISSGFWDPRQTQMSQVQQKAQGIRLFFPSYQSYVDRHHSGAEAIAVYALSSNLMDYFLQ